MESPESHGQIATIGGDLARPLAGTTLATSPPKLDWGTDMGDPTDARVPLVPIVFQGLLGLLDDTCFGRNCTLRCLREF